MEKVCLESACAHSLLVGLVEESTLALGLEAAGLEGELASILTKRSEIAKAQEEAEMELLTCEQQVGTLQLKVDSRRAECAVLCAGFSEKESAARAELERLQKELAECKAETGKLEAEKGERESELARLARARTEADRALERTCKELELTRLMQTEGEEAGEKNLREKDAMCMQIKANEQQVLEVRKSIEQADAELAKTRTENLRLSAEADRLDSRLAELAATLTRQGDRKKIFLSEISKNKNLILAAEIRRRDAQVSASAARAEIPQLEKRVKLLSAERAELDSRIASSTSELEGLLAELAVAERTLNARQDAYNTLSVENEFLRQKISALSECLADSQRRETREAAGLAKLESENALTQTEYERVERENGELEVKIATITADLEFLESHQMLDKTGRLHPCLVPDSPLVDQLGLNRFLSHLQAGEDVGHIVVGVVEKISQILEMIYQADQLGEKYEAEAKQMETIQADLKQRIARLGVEGRELGDKYEARMLQLGLNQVRAKLPTIFLYGVGYDKNLLARLLDSLTSEEKLGIQKFDWTNNPLEGFDFTTLLAESINLKELSLTNIDSQTSAQLVTYLRATEGITNVAQSPGVITAHSGSQLRLTIRY